ncbi:MAG TPA: ankyrin repeat domain-containing protein [Thermoanaerobaculia bacterium]|nr:ankyrin repeat domain-containing protein [Thermoanaerobaculia bacterium]
MAKSCTAWLLTWAVCGSAYWYFLHQRFSPPLDLLVPVAAGLLMALVLGSIRSALASGMSAMSVSRQTAFTGVSGERPPDGRLLTVSGHIRDAGAALRSPIGDRPAVLYSYDISHTWTDSNGLHAAKDYSGFAIGSAVIDSPYGAIRLLGFPVLEGFGETPPDQAVAIGRARDYVANTAFIDMHRPDPLAIYRETKERLTAEQGQARKDWRLTGTPKMPDDAVLHEEVVSPGETVTAIGRYSASAGGLVPDVSHPLSLMRGDARATAPRLWKKAVGTMVASLAIAAIANFSMFTVLDSFGHRPIALPKSDRQRRADLDALHDAARNGDIAALARGVAAGTPVDGRDAEGSTPLMRAVDVKTAAWLIGHGANVDARNDDGDTALMEHARGGRADVVGLLIRSGANVDVASRKWKSTALEMALDEEKLDVAQLLREAGARDVTVTAKNGTPIDERSEPVRAVMAYLDAIQREDLAAMNALLARPPLRDVDFKAWKTSRLIRPRLIGGFANDQAATAALRGKIASGIYETWTYQLVGSAGAWKITNERWETRFDGRQP